MDSDAVQFARELFERLWKIYRDHVPYARDYESLIRETGAGFVNDHLAFRTLRVEGKAPGIDSIAGIFERLGYLPQGPIDFPETRLHAVPYIHAEKTLPKIFISELVVSTLDDPSRSILSKFAAGSRWIDNPMLDRIANLHHESQSGYSELLDFIVKYLNDSPWSKLAKENDVRKVAKQSQYGSWVMLFGNRVNHFTALVNAHRVPDLDDIEKVVQQLLRRGVPMKEEIEGQRGSRLRQTATKAATVNVDVQSGTITWPYAYFEIAERGGDPDHPGQIFQGFLGPQAKELFDMTRRKE